MWLHTLVYRLWQVRQQLGFVAPLTPEECVEVGRWLPPSALPLFQTMSAADQRHSLRVCQGLQARGCTDKDMLVLRTFYNYGMATCVGLCMVACRDWGRDGCGGWPVSACRPLYSYTSPAGWSGGRITYCRRGFVSYAGSNRTVAR